MSLDVYLHLEEVKTTETEIYFREDGQIRKLTRAEWDERFPGKEPIAVERTTDSVFDWNITHNLNRMASEAGLYKAMWRPDEEGWTRAEQLIPALEAGLAALEADPDKFKAFNPENGWGNYEGLVRFARAYLEACKAWPMAEVSVSR